jgi:hypothetical protein
MHFGDDGNVGAAACGLERRAHPGEIVEAVVARCTGLLRPVRPRPGMILPKVKIFKYCDICLKPTSSRSSGTPVLDKDCNTF